jgi:Family of unknown function (DUF5996)
VDDAGTVWPDLPYGSWRETAATLQLHPDRGQGEPGSFLLGQLRSRGDPFFRADRPAPPRRRTRLARCGYARSLFARDRPVTPGAHFDGAVGEFILPYDTVRSAAKPDALLLDFLSTTYAAAAEIGGWDRTALECPIGVPGQVRRL